MLIDEPAREILTVKELHSWYDEAHILHGINLIVREGECVALLGRNGAGRTTTLKSIMGMVHKRQGSICVNGMETIKLSPDQIAHLGLGYCPEDRGIFASLSCAENLNLPKTIGAHGMSEKEIYVLFPSLKERANAPGGRLSGGEQQMLAIARILRAGAPILILDEVSEGLSPLIINTLAAVIMELKKKGYTILLVEQNLSFASILSDRMYIVEQGKIIEELNKEELKNKKSAIEALLGV